MIGRIGSCVAILALLVPENAQAQARTGDRVRVTAPSTLTAAAAGSLLSADTGALRVEVSPGVILTVPAASIERMELSEGRQLWRNILVGAAGGALVGALVGGVTLGTEAEGDDLGQAVGAMAGGVAGGILGAPIGGFVGAVAAREKWRRSALPHVDSSTAVAGAAIEVRPTTRIRVSSGSGRFSGRAMTSTEGLRVDDGDRVVPVAWADVSRLEVRGRNRKVGALIGGALLGGVTLVAAGVDYAEGEVSGGEFVFATGLNFAIGAGIGALIAPRTWRDVPLPRR